MSGLASSSSCPACLHYALRLPASYYNSSANRLVQSNLKKLVSGRTYTTSSEACTSTSTSNNASISNPFTRSVALTKLSQFRVQALDRLSKRQSDLRGRLNDAGNHINNVTGYGEIDRLKEEVQRRELELVEARTAAREAKEMHAQALSDRMASGREVNDLLTRKSTWLSSDVARFTSLVQSDHANEQKERDAKIDAAREEERVEKSMDALMKSILGRYHEEQIWSDKIRSLSTYGSLLITSINVLVFLLALTLVEPYKRRRMVAEVESRIQSRDERNSAEIENQLEGIKWLVLKGAGNLASWDTGNDKALSAPSSSASSSMGTEMDAQYLAPDEAIPADFPDSSDSLPLSLEATTARKQGQSVHPHLQSPHKRDLFYVGAVGAILGAALVSAGHALFG